MSGWPACPSLYEINTWVWLGALGRASGRRVTLGRVPREELERLAALGFDAVWLMGVWERSPNGRRVALAHQGLRHEYEGTLPDWAAEDVVGSPYAVRDYRVDPVLGGDDELVVLRAQLARLGLRLMLDFVPNHMALDHPWAAEHPDRLLEATPADREAQPENYFTGGVGADTKIFAHGRDPYFPGWTDTVQLDYRRPETRRAMSDVLLELAGRCDGVRCDMAMLVTSEIFRRTWGGEFDPPEAEFWPEAIAHARARYPDFLLLAEVYWDLEYRLQRMGFDYTYDKRLYDRLVSRDGAGVRAHLTADIGFQRRLARFVENHDEPRAMAAFGREASLAAATAALTLPGLRLFHEGQLEGRSTKLPVQLGRRPAEPADAGVERFYRRLLAELSRPVLREGEWTLLDSEPDAGDDGAILAWRWSLAAEHRVVVVNLSPRPARCRFPQAVPAELRPNWRMRDVLADRGSGTQQAVNGEDEFVELPGFGRRLFVLEPASN